MMQRNLKGNGGILDEVIFAVNTDDQDDLAYLETLLTRQPEYSKHLPVGDYDARFWLGNWEAVSDRDAVYVKIDDDVVFVEDGTIESVVTRLVDNPHLFAVSANVVNNPALSWVHSRLGVYEPYWPVRIFFPTKKRTHLLTASGLNHAKGCLCHTGNDSA